MSLLDGQQPELAPAGRKVTIERRQGHADDAGHLLRRLACIEQLSRSFKLRWRHGWPSPAHLASQSGRGQAGVSPFQDQLALHDCERGHDVEEEPPSSSPGVNPVRQRPQVNLAAFERSCRFQKTTAQMSGVGCITEVCLARTRMMDWRVVP